MSRLLRQACQLSTRLELASAQLQLPLPHWATFLWGAPALAQGENAEFFPRKLAVRASFLLQLRYGTTHVFARLS